MCVNALIEKKKRKKRKSHHIFVIYYVTSVYIERISRANNDVFFVVI